MQYTSSLAALKAKLEEANPKSDERGSFPLAAYLTIYTKAHHECYINYMEGARLLKDWIGPIKLPSIIPIQIPYLLRSYELHELAKILTPDRFQEAENMIYSHYITEPDPRDM